MGNIVDYTYKGEPLYECNRQQSCNTSPYCGTECFLTRKQEYERSDQDVRHKTDA